jgi:hypothetical protein
MMSLRVKQLIVLFLSSSKDTSCYGPNCCRSFGRIVTGGKEQKRTTKDSDGLNHWQLLIQKYFEFLSGLVS